jgi:hypothetical protein
VLTARREDLRLGAPPQDLRGEVVIRSDLSRDPAVLLCLVEPLLRADRVHEQRGGGQGLADRRVHALDSGVRWATYKSVGEGTSLFAVVVKETNGRSFG